jgi:hypothetical protein
MANRDKAKKIALFRRGAEAAAAIFHVPPDTYVCPLCGGMFGLEALESGELTLEHAPPRSMGGRGIVLTCHRCNSGAGHTVDAAVAERERAYAFMDAVNGLQTEALTHSHLIVGGERVNITFGRDGGAGAITILPDQNDPAAVERVNEVLERLHRGEEAGLELKVKMRRGFHGGQALAGDLKAAYLLAFAVFGYRWAAHGSLAPVRRQIADPESEIIGRWWLDADRVPEPTVALAETRTDPPFQCLAIRLKRSVVVLPWFDAGDLYERVATLEGSADGPLRFGAALRLPWPEGLDLRLDFLTDAQFAAFG